MLCAFANQNDLRQCLDAVNVALNSDMSDVLVFRATPRQGIIDASWDDAESGVDREDKEEESVFALNIKSGDKVRVLRDWRGMTELRKLFPSVDCSMINDIWKQQQCWQSCFDILGSLVKSHGSIIIEQCDLVIDEIHFPSLTISPTIPLQNSHRSSRSGSHDWTIISLERSFSTMSVSSGENGEEEMQKWEIVHAPLAEAARVVRSYKDALVTSTAIVSTHVDDAPKKRSWSDLAYEQSQREWKPVFVVTKVSNVRPDREYVSSMFDLDEEEAGKLHFHSSFFVSIRTMYFVCFYILFRHVLGYLHQCKNCIIHICWGEKNWWGGSHATCHDGTKIEENCHEDKMMSMFS